MPQRVFVVGVGMTKFEKPGKKNWDYPDMAREAGQRALDDACIPYSEVQQAVASYCYGDSTCGQRAVYELGCTGIPVYNVNNNCASGSSALFMAKQLVEGGISDCVLAIGFEKMERGSLGTKFNDRTNPLDKHMSSMMELREFAPAPPAPQIFGNAGREHMEKFGTTAAQIAKIAEKNHRHSVNNPYSQFRDEYSLEQVLKSRTVYEPLTMLQCCPTSEGAAANVVCNEAFVVKHGLQGQAVEIISMAMATDTQATFTGKSCRTIAGTGMTAMAAEKVFAQSGLSPNDVQVIELHDCFSANELVTYEGLGLCAEGQAGKLIDSGNVTYGGKWVVNPSGGLISKGHPLGATGLAQCAEICWQLRGEAGKRQVPNARVGLTHNLGLGGAAVVGLYRRPDAWLSYPAKASRSGGQGFDDESTAAAAAVPSAAPSAGPAITSQLKSAPIFVEIGKQLTSNAETMKKINAVLQWNIEGTSFVVDCKKGVVYQGAATPKADVEITVSDADFVAMQSGQLNSQTAFMQGKLKFKGNMGVAMKLGDILKPKSKL